MSTVGPAGEGPVLDGDEAETADPRGNPDGAAAAGLPDAAPRRIAWDETGESDQAAGVVGVARRRWVRPAVMVSVIVLAAVAWLVVWFRPGAAGPAERGPYAVDQVAQRYRALGADLLVGARNCAPLSPTPGQTERVSCAIGVGAEALTLELSSFDTPVRLRAVRDQALRAAPDSVRSARAAESGAAFVMDETAAGTSRMYWDVESPRPVSASVSADRPLAELVAFYDARRFTVLQRPVQPGVAFTAPLLWQLAAVMRTVDEGDCAAVPPAAEYPGTVEQVTCRFPNGVQADFGMIGDPAAFRRLRAALSAPPGIVPGSQWLGAWQDEALGDELSGQLCYYTLAGGNASRLYYDRREWMSFGVLRGPGTPEELHAFWVGTG